ncbi:MAG: UDP-4-amino-4,6-dideoxy-N-acetyl-beta-L-altrosamine transaminase [Deltaproteobacteria bacterium]|nr:UDP-4-amino-4,6-dideoxy-N-acetyl-beta-L-altrosamine transaminase [Deltaproteobacteria bacterium]
MKRTISYGRQTIDEDDIAAVTRVLGSGMLTQGPAAQELEDAITAHTGARYAVVCANGTAALHLACMAAGLGSKDSAITSPITFLATSNAALYVGARPVFADIDPETFNIDPSELEKKIEDTHRVKAIIPVHFAGLPCGMERIYGMARKKGLIVIEDACHALGASWKEKDGPWRAVGSSTHSDMTVFSFHPVKSITTGEGGAVTTNDRTLYERLKLLRSHGVTKDGGKFMTGNAPPWHYEMHELGYNYRLSDIQCALGISQMKKIERFIERRTRIAELYTSILSRYPFIKLPVVSSGFRSAYHLYPVRIAFDEIGVCKAEWFEMMKKIGVNLQVHYIPVHLQPYYRKQFGYRAGDFPVAERFYETEVSLPIYPLLTDEEVGAVTSAILSTLAHASTLSAKAARRQKEKRAICF